MKEINYDDLLENINEMINVHEYDGMRSAGKIRVNAPTLVELYALKERYEALAKKPVKKTTVEG